MVESLSKNVTRQGMTSTTLNYLRVSMNQYGPIYLGESRCESLFIVKLFFHRSCVSSWSRCKSSCPGTRRTRSTPGTASKPRSSRSGRRWSRPQVKKAENAHIYPSGKTADIWRAFDQPTCPHLTLILDAWTGINYDMPDFFCNWIVCWVKGICNVSLNVWL